MNRSDVRLIATGLIALIAVLVLARPLHASTEDSGVKLGLQTWTLRDMTFEQVVQFAAANHIQYLQLISQHLDPNAPTAEIERKKAMLDRHGLIPYALGVVATSSDPAANRRLFEVARLLGTKLIVVEPELVHWDNLEALVKEYDIRLAIHNHGAGTRYADPHTIKRILATRDSRIGVCLDTGWITEAGYDAAQVFRDYEGRVFDVHFKDKRIQGPANSSAIDTEIGKGNVNFTGLVSEMRRSGWSGVMAIETDSDEIARDPRSFVTGARDFLSSLHEDWIALLNGRRHR